MRRIVGTHATHSTHSVPGSGSISPGQPTSAASARCFGGCAVCARSFRIEDLYELDLFTPVEAPCDQPQRCIEAGKSDQCHDGEGDQLHGAAPRASKMSRFTVKRKCASAVHKLLGVRRYHKRWPKIPAPELFASSVQHPYVPEWRWLLHTRRVPLMEAGPDGRYPPVPACRDCAFCLNADTPKQIEMPMYAVANDNWIGRMPFAFTPRGAFLGEMTLKTLARGRMCVNKVFAEPERPGPKNTRQGGLRGNSIAFPQSKLELLNTCELPAPPEVAAEFMRNSVIIALAGAEKEDLHNAKWAEIPRQDYVDAARWALSWRVGGRAPKTKLFHVY